MLLVKVQPAIKRTISQPKNVQTMGTVKYNPFVPAKAFSNLFDEFFTRGLGDFVGADSIFTQPSVNVLETKDNFQIELAAPGLTKGDFEVKLDNGTLAISAKKENKEETAEGKYTRKEFNFASFTRSFQLPDTINAAEIAATYENGVLLVTLPKKEEAKVVAARTVEIG